MFGSIKRLGVIPTVRSSRVAGHSCTSVDPSQNSELGISSSVSQDSIRPFSVRPLPPCAASPWRRVIGATLISLSRSSCGHAPKRAGQVAVRAPPPLFGNVSPASNGLADVPECQRNFLL